LKKFLCLFLDHSGSISKTELKRVLNALNIKPSEKELQRLMTLMDSDHSGEIDYNEFRKVMADSFFKKHSKQELLGAFKKFDTDGNGYITTKELNDVLSRMGRHLNRNEVEAMIRSIDRNGDGKISFEEFCGLFD
jgi:Ca2+-binding EF-hand superfamily protein